MLSPAVRDGLNRIAFGAFFFLLAAAAVYGFQGDRASGGEGRAAGPAQAAVSP